MRLTAKSEYGLLALIDLAVSYEQGPVSARDIAEGRDIPPAFLEQLLATLRREGLVTSVRGARGGFVLAREPKTITALDIVEALEGPLAPTICDTHDACGREGACAAEPVWTRVSQTLRDVLAGFDLDMLATRQTIFDAAFAADVAKEQ